MITQTFVVTIEHEQPKPLNRADVIAALRPYLDRVDMADALMQVTEEGEPELGPAFG